MGSPAAAPALGLPARRHSLLDRLAFPSRVAIIATVALTAGVLAQREQTYVLWVTALVAGLLLTSSA